jgi:hypothetical protein
MTDRKINIRQQGNAMTLLSFFLNKEWTKKGKVVRCAQLIKHNVMKTYEGVEVYLHHSLPRH